MAFTRSSYKCCISGIGLDTTEALNVTVGETPKVIHARLWNSWSLLYGFEFLPDGQKNVTGSTASTASAAISVSESAKNDTAIVSSEAASVELKSLPSNFSELQQQFILKELFALRAEIMVDHALTKEEQSAHFKYIKVLFSWFLSLDAQCALIELNRFIETLQVFIAAGQTEAAENTLNLLQMIMVAIFNNPTASDVVTGIDEVQARTVASETALWRYIILANGIVSTEEYTF